MNFPVRKPNQTKQNAISDRHQLSSLIEANENQSKWCAHMDKLVSRLVITANNQTAKQQLINIRRQNGPLTQTHLLLAVHVAA